VDGDAVQIGQPTVQGLSVTGTVLEQRRGEKIRVFKYRPKSRYSRTSGHRQQETVIRIDAIGGQKAPKAEARSEKATDAKPEKPATRSTSKKVTKE
jgi:large subunit ribosomal protein L21